jgi:hypothetical protein
MDDILPEFNEGQRQKVANLGFQALEQIDEFEGDHIILDAMLLLEVGEKDADTDEVTYFVHRFSTTPRSAVQRGIVEHIRDDLSRFDD